MPSPGLTSAVSEYEQFTSKFGSVTSKYQADDRNENDDHFIAQKKKKHTNQFKTLTELKEMTLSKALHDDNGHIEAQNRIPRPLAWSPGMTLYPHPSLSITPEKPSRQGVDSPNYLKDDTLKAHDISKIPQPVAWSPGMKFQPNPSLFVTPDKTSVKRVVSVDKTDEKSDHHTEVVDNNVRVKEKYSVRFDLPSASSGEEAFDESSSCSGSPITLKGSQISPSSSPVWKPFSPQKYYDPNIYSDDSALDESIFSSLPSASDNRKPKDLKNKESLKINFAQNNDDSGARKVIELYQTSSLENLNSKPFSRTTELNKKTSKLDVLSSDSSTSLQCGELSLDSLTNLKNPKQCRKKQDTVEDKVLEPAQNFVKSSSWRSEPPTPALHVIREAKNNLVSTEYSFPFDAGAVGGDLEYEHIFARPEFNSTIKIRSELNSLCQQEVDVQKAVEATLSNSEVKRSELNEKAALYTNRTSNQFRDLVDLDASVETLCQRVVRMRTSKAKKMTCPKDTKSTKTEKTPDLMEFFTSDLQSQNPDLNLPGIQPITSLLKTSPHDIAFDLYRHNRVWHGLHDF
ncbi:unnamed protein product [Lymnaea stagnalis]|uniref:Protein phosphatase 1 regulatory subunit 35 C-terminal domain-containing protein n=1 Tax=Lymnaea stagnalis TaxID=6523 RepID=A0AAV2HF72_LYMST